MLEVKKITLLNRQKTFVEVYVVTPGRLICVRGRPGYFREETLDFHMRKRTCTCWSIRKDENDKDWVMRFNNCKLRKTSKPMYNENVFITLASRKMGELNHD